MKLGRKLIKFHPKSHHVALARERSSSAGRGRSRNRSSRDDRRSRERSSSDERRPRKRRKKGRKRETRSRLGRVRKLSALALAANAVVTKTINARAAHDFLVNHALHPDGWEAEVTKTDGRSIGARLEMILDSGSDFVLLPTQIADIMVREGAILYPPSQRLIEQASTTAEVRGMLYGTLMLHSPDGGVVTFKKMQFGVLDGDTILISNWVMDQMRIDSYSIAEEFAKRHAVFEGNSTFIPMERPSPRVRSLRVEEPAVTASFDSCMEQIPAMTKTIKARYIAASERIDREARIDGWSERA